MSRRKEYKIVFAKGDVAFRRSGYRCDKQQHMNFKRTPEIFPFDFENSEGGASALALQLAALSARKTHWGGPAGIKTRNHAVKKLTGESPRRDLKRLGSCFLYGRVLRCRGWQPVALEGMRNVQRLLTTQNPRVAEIKIDDLVDKRYMRKTG